MTIGANLQWTITKTGSVGGSESLMGQWSVTADDLKRQGCALFFYPEHLWRCYDFPLQIQFSLVGEMEQAVSEREEFLDVFVVGQGPSDVVHLRAVVLSARVWKKQNSWDWQRPVEGLVWPLEMNMNYENLKRHHKKAKAKDLQLRAKRATCPLTSALLSAKSSLTFPRTGQTVDLQTTLREPGGGASDIS